MVPSITCSFLPRPPACHLCNIPFVYNVHKYGFELNAYFGLSLNRFYGLVLVFPNTLGFLVCF